MTDQQQAAQRRGREGGRWINERPTPEAFGTWFATNVKLDPSLNAEDYVGGVVLIPAVDTKAKHVDGFTTQGVPLISEREELSYIPYAKVETRINYYWDLLDVHPEWVGVIEHVTSPRMPIDFVNTTEKRETDSSSWTSRELRTPSALTALVHQLPEGFSVMTVPVSQGYSNFLCCTIRVSIYDREELKANPKAHPRRTGRGTKQVPMLKGRSNPWADDSALMKAETGALGRALGFAGIFVIPGSGVATAEDVQEALTQGAAPAEPVQDNTGPATPEPVAPARTGAEQSQDAETELKARAIALMKALREDKPGKAEEFTEWAHTRGLTSLAEAKGATLIGVVKKLEKLSDEEVPDVPAQAAESVPTEPLPVPAGEASGAIPG